MRRKLLFERGGLLGRAVWVEKNNVLLERLEPILEALNTGKTHHLAGKKGREYVVENVPMPSKHTRNTEGVRQYAQQKKLAATVSMGNPKIYKVTR